MDVPQFDYSKQKSIEFYKTMRICNDHDYACYTDDDYYQKKKIILV